MSHGQWHREKSEAVGVGQSWGLWGVNLGLRLSEVGAIEGSPCCQLNPHEQQPALRPRVTL